LAYKSGFERTVTANLTSRKIKFEYETIKLPYTLEGTYNPDLLLVDSGIIVELKGVLDREAKRKMIAVRKQYPDKDIRIVFMNANKKVPGTKQTHGEWATKNGYTWAEGKIPEEWLNE
jgi:hypothetical protein